MSDLRPHFVLCEKTQAWHSPVCWIKSLVPMGIASDVHHRESLVHDVNHSSLGEAFLFTHRAVWLQCSQQPLPGPMLGKERDYRLLVPMAVSHLLPLQEMSPRFLWDMQSLLCCPWQPPHPAGLTLTCTELSPKAPRCCRGKPKHFVARGSLLQLWSSSTKHALPCPSWFSEVVNALCGAWDLFSADSWGTRF